VDEAIRVLTLIVAPDLGEIQTLKWSYVNGNKLLLPDSKTGAKTVYLGAPAIAALKAIPRQADNDYVIAGKVPGQHLTDLQRPWRRLRKRAGLEDLLADRHEGVDEDPPQNGQETSRPGVFPLLIKNSDFSILKNTVRCRTPHTREDLDRRAPN